MDLNCTTHFKSNVTSSNETAQKGDEGTHKVKDTTSAGKDCRAWSWQSVQMINWHVTESEEKEGEEEKRLGQELSAELDILSLVKLWVQQDPAVIKETTFVL